MDDAVARYIEASEQGDIETLMGTLAPDVEVVSPISGRMIFRGEADVRVLLTAVYGSLKGLRWTRTLGEGEHLVVLGEARLLGVRLTDAMVFELAPDGRIRRIGPHLRPWLALTLLALVLGPQVGRRPGMIWRALRAGGG
ncbi:MAG TPA: nuclear transport factor 2 family protein [Solirubrobacterales bacterium]